MDRENKYNFLSSIIKNYLPYLGSMLILIGATQSWFYYRLFNIDIFYYLDFTEIITLFLGDFIVLIFFILASIAVILIVNPESLFNKLFNLLSKWIINILKFLSDKISLKIKDNTRIILTIHVYLIILFFSIIVFLITGLKDYFASLIVAGIVTCFAVFFEIQRRKVQQNISFLSINSNGKTLLNLSFIVLFLIGVVLVRSYSQYSLVKDGKLFNGTIINLKDSIIICDSNIYYIGKTKNYIFVHNEKEENNSVIPLTEVKTITIKQKEPLIQFRYEYIDNKKN